MMNEVMKSICGKGRGGESRCLFVMLGLCGPEQGGSLWCNPLLRHAELFVRGQFGGNLMCHSSMFVFILEQFATNASVLITYFARFVVLLSVMKIVFRIAPDY